MYIKSKITPSYMINELTEVIEELNEALSQRSQLEHLLKRVNLSEGIDVENHLHNIENRIKNAIRKLNALRENISFLAIEEGIIL